MKDVKGTRAPDEREFEDIVARAYERLPEQIRARMDNVAVTIDDVVDPETMKAMGLESNMELLGYYHGVPRIDRMAGGFELPDKIVLYRLPIIEDALETGKSVEDVAYETLWHEVAHHFGMGEEDVRRREGEEFGE